MERGVVHDTHRMVTVVVVRQRGLPTPLVRSPLVSRAYFWPFFMGSKGPYSANPVFSP